MLELNGTVGATPRARPSGESNTELGNHKGLPLREFTQIPMKYDPQRHHRRSVRLKGYNYSLAGAYYVTIVAQNRACLFGEVVNSEMILTDAGVMLRMQWDALTERFPNVELDEFVVMPNHFHGILLLTDAQMPIGTADGRNLIVGTVIGAWKSITTDEYIRGVKQSNWIPFEGNVWQRNYWEHIIRNEIESERIREYIFNNPANWANDENNPVNVKPIR